MDGGKAKLCCLAFGNLVALPPALPCGGNPVSPAILTELQGLSALAQAIVLNLVVGLALSDGLEIIVQ